MGRGRVRRRVCADEAVRGQSYPRRHSQACVQDTSNKASDVGIVEFCGHAVRFGLAAGTKAGLKILW